MLESDKTALQYEQIAYVAHKIEKVSQKLSSLYKDSSFSTSMLQLSSRINLRKRHLSKYIKELNELLNKID